MAGEWFDEARFGVFVHWGHSSQLGCELSWPLAGVGDVPLLAPMPAIPPDTYHAGGTTFCPDRGAATAWLDAARAAGARYAVLTAKHHNGYALWPTARTDWSIARSPYGGDLVAEFVEATRTAGLRVGLYMSLSDWHHPDYPPITEAAWPYLSAMVRRPAPEAWARYVEVLHGQVEELLSGYGQIDLLWFDGQWERTPDEWRAADLAALARRLQPGIMINDRLPGQGDYETPEQSVPAQPPGGRWETCLTMNRTWGWNPDDHEYKSATELIHILCETAGKGGNLLLNLSPRADGRLPAEQIERMAAIAGWMDTHGDAIHGTTPGLEPWQFYGPSTRKGDRIFLHLLWKPYGRINVRGMPIRRVAGARHLASGDPLVIHTAGTGMDTRVGQVTIEVPDAYVDEHATVIELVMPDPS